MLKTVMSSYNVGVREDESDDWETDEDVPNVSEFVEVEHAVEEAGDCVIKTSKEKKKKSTGTVRRSLRGLIPVNAEKDDYVWTIEEKKGLLRALKQYGHLDMDHLREAIPRKSRSAIESMIVKWWRRAAMLRQNEIDDKPMFDRRLKEFRCLSKKRKKTKKKQPVLAPIEQWIQHVRKAGSPSVYLETRTLARAMLYISVFEKHPDPAECDGIDYSALYDYLYRMLMGYPPKELNKATQEYLIQVMDKLASKISSGDFHGQLFHLKSVRKISLEPTTIKQYGRSRRNEDTNPVAGEDAWMKSLLEIPGFNPLSTTLELLKL